MIEWQLSWKQKGNSGPKWAGIAGIEWERDDLVAAVTISVFSAPGRGV